MGPKECPMYPCFKWSSVSHGRTDMLDDQHGFNSCSHRLKGWFGSHYEYNYWKGCHFSECSYRFDRMCRLFSKRLLGLQLEAWIISSLFGTCSAPQLAPYVNMSVTCLLWLGQSTYVATGCVDGKMGIWDSRSGDSVRTLDGHTSAIQSIAASSNGEYLVSASMDGTARAFEIADFN